MKATKQNKGNAQVSATISLLPTPFVPLSLNSFPPTPTQRNNQKHPALASRIPCSIIYWAHLVRLAEQTTERKWRLFPKDLLTQLELFTKITWNLRCRNLTFIPVSKMTWHIVHAGMLVRTPFIPHLASGLHAWCRQRTEPKCRCKGECLQRALRPSS